MEKEVADYRNQVLGIKGTVEKMRHPSGRCKAMEKFIIEMCDVWLYELEQQPIQNETESTD